MWELNRKTDMDDDKGHCPYWKDTKESRDQVLQWIKNILNYYKENTEEK